MELNEKNIEKMQKDYGQLRKIICQQSKEGNAVKEKLKGVERIIHTDLPELIKKVAPPNVYELLGDFYAEYDKFRDFMLYRSLIGKHVIGLGGAFSSGKSTFLNKAVIHKNNTEKFDILPTDTSPSTSVPAYVVHGEKHQVKAINIFDAYVTMEMSAIKDISHKFGEIKEDGQVICDGVPVGHILKNMFLETSFLEYRNLAFLDTPGYSKPDGVYSERTDENIARQQLNTADYILWFLPMDSTGSFTNEDIKFLKSLNQKIPVSVICTKANRRLEKEALLEKLRSQISQHKLNIEPQHIFLYDREVPDGFDINKIYALLDEWDKVNYDKNVFAKRFKRLFWECKKYYEKCREEVSGEIRNLQSAHAQSGGDEIKKYVERVIVKSKAEKIMYENAIKEISELQTIFFKAIRMVAMEENIYMPEPSEIEVLGDKITNPLTVLQDYNRENNCTVPKDLKEKVEDMLRGVTPVFECEPGGSKYTEVITDIMSEIGFPSKEEIQFDRDTNYAELLGTVLSGTSVKNEKLTGEK